MEKQQAQAAAPQRSQWFRDVVATIGAGSPVVMLHGNTTDYERVGVTVTEYLGRVFTGYPVVAMFSISKGIHFPGGKEQAAMRAKFFHTVGIEDKAPDAPFFVSPEQGVALLLGFLKQSAPGSAMVIIDRLDDLVGELMPVSPALINTMELLHNAGTDKELKAQQNPLILITPRLNDVRDQVRRVSSGIALIEIPLPDEARRYAFAKELSAKQHMENVKFDGITMHEMASKTAGLMLQHIEKIMLRGKKNAGRITRDIVLDVQRQIMDQEYGGVLKRVDKPFRLANVGGHREAKGYAEKRLINVAGAPNAILWVGPPGTGKTMIANAIANESGMNCLEVDLSLLLGGIVGETEKNVAKFKEGMLASVPCHIIMDEIDQKIRRGEGGPDSGGGGSVENRLFSSILEIVGDTTLRGKVVIHFMSNRPELLDPAFVSRMGAIIPLLPPADDEARADVLYRIVERLNVSGQVIPTREQLLPLAARVANWSGRELEHCVAEALNVAPLDGVSVLEALGDTVTYYRPNLTDVEEQINQALDACKDMRLVPEQYRDRPRSGQANQPKRSNDWTQTGVPGTRKLQGWN